MSDKIIWPHDLDPWQQVQLGIGEYVIAFSNMEGSITSIAAEILGHPHSRVAFFSRDMSIGLKSKLARRAAQHIVPSGELRKSLLSLLNGASEAAEYRNELLHGAFVYDDQLGITLVKDGNSPSKVWEGREPISYKTISDERAKIDKICGGLSDWRIEWMKFVQDPENSEKNTGGPASMKKKRAR